MIAAAPGDEVHARGRRWAVVSAHTLGPQILYRLRGVEVLAHTAAARQPLKLGDLDDPGPWLEAFAEGSDPPSSCASCGSSRSTASVP